MILNYPNITTKKRLRRLKQVEAAEIMGETFSTGNIFKTQKNQHYNVRCQLCQHHVG